MARTARQVLTRTAADYNEIRPLAELCKAGKLYEVEDWIRQGKPIDPPIPPKGRQRTPLLIAIERGFHSLVLLLLRSGASLEQNGDVLAFALQCNRHDLIELLFQFGADVQSVDFEYVGHTWNPLTMRLFIEKGLDPLEDNNFGKVLHCKVRTAIGVFKEYKSRIPGLQQQADMALRRFCRDGNLKWVCLLLWAGANPRARVPDLYDEEEPEDYRSGLEQAVHCGRHEVIKKIGINPREDDLTEVAVWASIADSSTELLQDLIRMGAKLNNKPNSGSDVLERLLWQLGWYSDPRPLFGDRSTSKIENVLQRIKLVIESGARWIPSESHEYRSLRKTLYQLEIRYVLDLVRSLRSRAASSDEDLAKLLDQPRMKDHLGGFAELGKLLPAFREPKSRSMASRSRHG